MILKIVFLIGLFHQEIAGHGRMLEPLQRNSVWRMYPDYPVDPKDDYNNCGGVTVSMITNRKTVQSIQSLLCSIQYHFNLILRFYIFYMTLKSIGIYFYFLLIFCYRFFKFLISLYKLTIIETTATKINFPEPYAIKHNT